MTKKFRISALSVIMIVVLGVFYTSCKKDEVEPDEPVAEYAIGDFTEGGVVFYILKEGDTGYDVNVQHGFVCAVKNQDLSEWGCYRTEITGADGTAIGTGSQNTIDIEEGCTTAGTAADICANLTLNNHSDWFLPSKDELTLMYENKAKINTTATDNEGSNFEDAHYWSSTEYDGNFAWLCAFSTWHRLSGLQSSASPNRMRIGRA